MKSLKVRGRKFYLKKLNPKVFELAAQMVLKKNAIYAKEYPGGCISITKACMRLDVGNIETHKSFLSALFSIGEMEYQRFSKQFHVDDIGHGFFWGSTKLYRNQKCRSTALLLTAQIVKSLQ